MNENNEPLFSVIIPAYNYGHSLERVVLSVLGQDCSDYELETALNNPGHCRGRIYSLWLLNCIELHLKKFSFEVIDGGFSTNRT